MSPIILNDLTDYFASLLRVPSGNVSTTANVLDLGADSIMLLEARSWIETRYGRRIEIRQFFEELNTIEAIAAVLAESIASADVSEPSSAPAPLPAPPGFDAGPATIASADIGLMRAQLELVAEVIERQNRVAANLRGRAQAVASRETAEGRGTTVGGQPSATAAFSDTEVTAA